MNEFFSRSNGFAGQASMSVGSTYVGWKILGERVALTLNRYKVFFFSLYLINIVL